MSWESRPGSKSKYYFWAERHAGKLVKTYFGSGARAKFAAETDSAARKAREADAMAARALVAELEPLEAQTLAMMVSVEEITKAALLAAGCHQHHGSWRRSGKAKRSREIPRDPTNPA